MELLNLFTGTSIGLISGLLIGYFIINKLLQRKKVNVLKNAEIDAENIKKSKIIQAKEKFIELAII